MFCGDVSACLMKRRTEVLMLALASAVAVMPAVTVPEREERSAIGTRRSAPTQELRRDVSLF